MSGLITAAAQWLPFLVPLVAAVTWLTLPRDAKLPVVAQAILALALAATVAHIASLVYFDPRPFVVDPGQPPLFPHPPDNGFPSDHTTFTGAIALLVMTYRRRTGVILLVVSVIVGAARVAAHVHHVPDIIGGLVVATVAVWLTTTLWRRLTARRARPLPHDVDPTTTAPSPSTQPRRGPGHRHSTG